MSELFSKVLEANSLGLILLSSVMAGIGALITNWIKNRGATDTARINGEVALREVAGNELVALVQELKAQKTELAAENARLSKHGREVSQKFDRVADLILAILQAPDDVILKHEMDRAHIYMKRIGRAE